MSININADHATACWCEPLLGYVDLFKKKKKDLKNKSHSQCFMLILFVAL